MEKILILSAIAFAGWLAHTHTGRSTTSTVAGNPAVDVAPWDIVYNYPNHFTGGSIALPQLAAGQDNVGAGDCAICSILGGTQF